MPSLKELFRTATAVVLFLAAASLFTHNSSNAAPAKSTAPVRGYYLTKDNFLTPPPSPVWDVDNGATGGTLVACDGTLGGNPTIPVNVGVWCVQD